MLILLLGLCLLLFNLVASVLVWKRHEVPAQQRVAQLLMVWLLPVVGGLLCIVFVAMTRATHEDGGSPGAAYTHDSGFAWDDGRHDAGHCAEDAGGSACGGADGGD